MPQEHRTAEDTQAIGAQWTPREHRVRVFHLYWVRGDTDPTSTQRDAVAILRNMNEQETISAFLLLLLPCSSQPLG